MHLGIDLGGTKIETRVVDASGDELYRKRIASPRGSYEQSVDAIISCVRTAETKLGSVMSLGLGIPGAIEPDTQCVKNANSTWLIGRPLKADLEHRLGRNISVGNDADCFTLSEAWDGAGQDYQSVFGVIMGTGVGGGFAFDKRIGIGANAIRGEWGHNPLPVYSSKQSSEIWEDTNPSPCYCGKSNCIEALLSGPGLVKDFLRTQPTCPEDLTSEGFFNLVQEHNDAARRYFEVYVDRLARALAGIINTVDPHIIVLGGGLSKVEALYTALPKHIRAYVFSPSFKTPIVPAVHGDASGARGACWLGALGGTMELTTR